MKQKFKASFDKLLNPLRKLKVLNFFLNNSSNFKNALGLMIIYWILSMVTGPKRVNFEYVQTQLSEGSKIEFKLSDYSTNGKTFLLKMNGSRLSFLMYLDEVQDQTKKLEIAGVVLPKDEMSFFEKQSFYYFVDFIMYAAGLFFLLGLKDFLVRIQSNPQANVVDKEKSKVKFSDVCGIDNIRGELQEVVENFQNSEKVKSYGGRVISGVIMSGPPGTGKTLMAKAVAGEANATFMSISGSQFVQMYVGVGASRVRQLFEDARKAAPCVIFIDEIDAFAMKRGTERSHSENDQTINEMLAQMDGFKDNTGVLVIAATNRLDNIDEALLRPGRFDRKIVVNKPSLEGRKEILSLYINKSPRMSSNIDIDMLAKATTFFSGAELKNLVDEAIYLAIKEKSEYVTHHHFMEAKDRIQMGSASSIKVSVADKKITAYHEIGHALVSYLKKVGVVSQVSIVPRGMALGVTQMVEDEIYSYNTEYCKNRLMMLMGGKVAEKEFCKVMTTGVSDDLNKATDLARRMVCEWGMGKIGPVNVSFGTTNYSLLSDQMKFMIDQGVIEILKDAELETTKLLTENKDMVEYLVEALIKKETISAVEFDEACSRHNASKVETSVAKNTTEQS